MIKRRRGRNFDLSITVKAGNDNSIRLNNIDYKVVMTSEFGSEHDIDFDSDGNTMTLHFVGAETASWPWGRYKLTLLHGESRDLDIVDVLELVSDTSQEI